MVHLIGEIFSYRVVKKEPILILFFFFSTQRNEVPMPGMLSVGFCGNTVKISSTSDEAYTSYSTITMELPLASLSNFEHCSVIQFLMVENESVVEIHSQLVNVYGNCVMNVQNVCKWRRDFLKGRVDIQDEQCVGRPKDVLTSDSIASVRALLDDDCCLMVRQMQYLMGKETT